MKPKHQDRYNQLLIALKEKIRTARLRTVQSVNTQMLKLYWEIGNIIVQEQKEEGWGTKVIDTLSDDLRKEFKDMKGLAPRNLRYMRDFALAYPDFLSVQQSYAALSESEQKAIWQPVVAKLEAPQKSGKKKKADKTSKSIWQPVVAKLQPQKRPALLAGQLPWAHNIVLLYKIQKTEDRIFYAEKAIQNGWSRRVLETQIETNLIKRTGKAITNFETTLPPSQSDLAKESFKNPYVLDFIGMTEEMQERELEKALIAHLKEFLRELGKGFAYVGNQYHLDVAGDDYFLDLLFFNYHLNCFVIFELKIGEFNPDYTGKLNFYINAVDEKIKLPQHNPTIGILLCKTPNKTVVEYALRGMVNPLGVTNYDLSKALPAKLKTDLPTVEELEKEIDKGYEELQTPADKRLKRLKEIISLLKVDEIKEKRNAKNCKVIFMKVVLQLKHNLEKSLAEIAQEFEEQQWTVWIDNMGVRDEDNAVKQLQEKGEAGEMKIEVRFLGLKKAGVKAFNIGTEMMVELRDFYYKIARNRNDSTTLLERVYHILPTKKEMKEIEEAFKGELYEQLEQHLERIRK